MASAVISSVPTTASRFALLQVDSGSDSDSEPGKGRGSRAAGKSRTAGAGVGKTNTNEKKKEKRRKKKEQQQSEANELRNLAFKKIPQKSSQGIPGAQHEQALPNVVRKEPQEENWQQWRQKDDQELDSPDNTSPQSKSLNKKEKRKNHQGKDKPLTVALKDFQSENNIDTLNKKQEELRTSHAELQDSEFFNRLEDDVSKILIREKRREHNDVNGMESFSAHEYSHEHFLKDGKTEQLKQELEKKDAEMQQLKKVVTQWEAKYKEVKARNAQLLKMLQEGEMKDKADILLQVDELLTIKNELTLQVTGLHVALEQERSKVKGLQAELLKYQAHAHARLQQTEPSPLKTKKQKDSLEIFKKYRRAVSLLELSPPE